MKRWISLLAAMLLAVLMLAPASALAEGNGSLRHEVTGDVSTFEVDESAGLSQSEVKANATEATIGTEVYLFVDPDSASYVTFYVTDEDGNPIEGALIYITYNGITELYGTTGADGKCSMYLFRDVEYGYKVTKTGYETAYGSFTATRETKTVHVVLRKLNTLTVYVVDIGTPQAGITVKIDGKEYVTDSEGKVQVKLPDGEYNVVVIAPDGREIPVQVIVDGDTVVVIDIGQDADENGNGFARYHDRFLVFNKLYNPEDYVLTRYDFKQEDIVRENNETDDAYQQRVERYLTANPRTILIEAQPERIQNDDMTDTDILKDDGTPLYAQRSLMPTGYLLRAWETNEYEKLVFTNEEAGIKLDLENLHSPDMTRLYALIWALNNSKVDVCDILIEEMKDDPKAQAAAGLADVNRANIDLMEIDLSAIRAFEFGFDHDLEPVDLQGREDHELLSNSLFTNTLFEFRITPILPEAMEDMVVDGLLEKSAIDKDEIMLANRSYFEEQLRRWQADGRLTDTECSELFQYVIDGRLEVDEIEELRRQAKEGTLSSNAVELLIQAAVDDKMYRVSCWIIYGDIRVNVTTLIETMQVVWDADRQYEEEYNEQLQLLIEQEKAAGRSTDNLETRFAAQLEQDTTAELEAEYQLVSIDNQGIPCTDANYTAGMHTQIRDVLVKRTLPPQTDEFHDLLAARIFGMSIVDVRKEEVQLSNRSVEWYRAYITDDSGRLDLERFFETDLCISGLAWMEKTEQ